jgi:CubicO group peptidase (beta-lactamase class C family)
MQRAARHLFALVLALTSAAVAQSGLGTAAPAAETIARISGTWEGQIETPPPLGVVVRLEHDAGAWRGTIDIPLQGAIGLPLDSIEVDDDVRFAIAGLPGDPTFAGTVGDELIAGTFTQGGTSFPFELTRVDEEVAPPDAVDPDAAAPAVPGPGPADPAAAPGEPSEVFEDPDGVFTIPIPAGWTLEEHDEYVRMVSPEGGIRLHFLVREEDDLEAVIERGWATVYPDFDVPVDAVLRPPSDPGIEATVVVNYDNPRGQAYQAIAQLHEGMVHVMLVDAELEAVQRRGSQVNLIFSGYRILALEESDLVGVEPLPVGDVLDQLEAFIDQNLQAFGIPGAAVAVVQDDEVVYASGFGVRREGGAAMSADTHMMIGSTGKTITTMLMAALVDDGLFDWDTPVVEVLPQFRVADPELTEAMVMWHLVCACSGVPRRDLELLFNADALTAEDVVESLATFEFFTDFGEVFQYSNQLVGTGGYAAAAAAGVAWGNLWQGYADALERRLLEPIGMSNTTLSFEQVLARGEHAFPHQLDLETGAYGEVSLEIERLLLPIAPAGSHWSTAEDMARYMITQLSVGVTPDGARVVSEENLRATWEPTVPITATASYGLGWIVAEYRGLQLLTHGGNTLGFTSEFAFLPEVGVGVLVLTNAQGTNMFNTAVRDRLFELVFEQPSQAEDLVAFALEQTDRSLAELQERLLPEVDEAAIAPYLGTFLSPVLGTITITLEDGVLMLDAGEFRTELRPAVDAEGEVEHYIAMGGPLPTAPLEFTEEDGESVIVLGEGLVSYTFVRVEE